ncbi:MAG: NAD-dependent epimerase/dehydratase family protein [Pseudobutyrivibrio sp.]|nr:NAD-dependent epimerase/dehydratase family protein [Pseudobutyrivibrio sp.]
MKYLVTGANGYIGQGVVRRMLDLGAEVIATDFHTADVDDRAKKIDADLFDLEDPYTYFDKPDVVIHLAWRDGFRHASENHMLDLPRHFEFVNKMCHAGIRKMCVMGTMHEIGFMEGCIKEDSPCHPQSLYGIAKNALRLATGLACKETGVKLQWLRGYYIVGNTHKGCSIFSKLTAAAEAGDETFPFTSGQNQFDFTDYDLFCDQVAKSCMQDDILGIIECCTGHPMKLADRVEKFISDNNYAIKLAYGTFPDRPYDSKAVWGDNTKINQIMADFENK